MARRPIQSALGLTVKTIFFVKLLVVLMFLVDLCYCNDLYVDEVMTSRLVNVPKFGDRLSPRHRPFIEDKNKNTNINIKLSKNNNNLSNNNNNNLTLFIRNDEINRSDNVVTSATQSINDYNSNLDYYSVTVSDDDILSQNTNKNNILHNLIDHKNQVKDNLILNTSSASAQAHRLEMSTEFFVVPSTVSSIGNLHQIQHGRSRSTTGRPGGFLLSSKSSTISLSSSSVTSSSASPTIVDKMNVTPPTVVATHPTGLRKEPWVIPVLVLASLSMIMMAAFEIFVLCKAWRTSPSRRHLFLGQMLLLGLFACSGLAAVLSVTPTILSCGTIRFGAGVAFALVFASLLVKCVFLISLNGGVYLPAPYQGLLLLFAVLIQVAVGAQWLLTSPPGVDNVPIPAGVSGITSRYHLLLTAGDLTILNPTIPLCRTAFSELLLSLIYVVFLIIFVAILAIKSRGIRDNYREATYIGLAVGGTIPIWLGWTLCGLAVADRHRDACLAFGLVATASTVFLVMFMPKGRQLAAMGKEGLYVEDREERLSSLSRAGSGYSPSFFHFKPIKYGVMGPSPNSNTNTCNVIGGTSGVGVVTAAGASPKHQAVATLGGDHVALVAAPPSYTRMYHYFPAHMTHPFCYYPTPPTPAHYPSGLFMRPDDANLYTTLEQTMSSNPNVFFQRGGVHPGMMY